MGKKEQEILWVTQEECAEVIQVISKINRFGIDGEHQGHTNLVRLTEEIGDLYCMLGLLVESGLVSQDEVVAAAEKKREKLKIWSNIFKEE